MNDERSEVLGALKFPVPLGWTAQQQVMLQLPHVPQADVDFQPNIVMRRLPAPGASVDEIAEDRAQLLAQHLPQFERGSLLYDQLLGQRTIRMAYTWHNGKHPLRQLMVLCALDGWLYEITFSDASQRFEQTLPAFEHWLSALAVSGVGRGGLDISTLFGKR